MSAANDLLRLGIDSRVKPGEVTPRKSASHGEAGYARRPHDAYFTEPWVTRALVAAVEFAPSGRTRAQTVIWEPACGDGRMAEPLKAAGYQVVASDIGGWGYGAPGIDFLDPASADASSALACDAIVTNPPFDQAVLFIGRALQLMQKRGGKVAMLQRHEFDAPASHHPLFRPPFAAKLVLHKRPAWSDDDPKGPGASPRFPYAWYVWDWRLAGIRPILRYLPDPDAAPAAIGALL